MTGSTTRATISASASPAGPRNSGTRPCSPSSGRTSPRCASRRATRRRRSPATRAQTRAPRRRRRPGLWKGPAGAAVNAARLNALLAALSDLTCEKFIPDRGKESFGRPVFSITLTGGQEHSLSIFAPSGTDSGDHPAVSSASDSPFVLSAGPGQNHHEGSGGAAGNRREKRREEIKRVYNPLYEPYRKLPRFLSTSLKSTPDQFLHTAVFPSLSDSFPREDTCNFQESCLLAIT